MCIFFWKKWRRKTFSHCAKFTGKSFFLSIVLLTSQAYTCNFIKKRLRNRFFTVIFAKLLKTVFAGHIYEIFRPYHIHQIIQLLLLRCFAILFKPKCFLSFILNHLLLYIFFRGFHPLHLYVFICTYQVICMHLLSQYVVCIIENK